MLATLTPCKGANPRRDVYLVSEFECDWSGRAFYFKKGCIGSDPSEEGYSVFCARNNQDSHCECKGFVSTGGCKHLRIAKAYLEHESGDDLVNQGADVSSVENPF